MPVSPAIRAIAISFSVCLGALSLSACSDGGSPPVIKAKSDTENKPPVANAGADITVRGGKQVSLDGSNSSDPDGTIESYRWSQLTGSAVSLPSLTTPKITFTTPTTGGVLEFQLTVTDDSPTARSDVVFVDVRSGVAIFNNTSFVDYSNTNSPGSEASNLKATLESETNENITTFTGFSNSAITGATIPSVLALAIPEQELGSLEASLPVDARHAFTGYVANGGILIVFRGHDDDNDLPLLNNIFAAQSWALTGSTANGTISLNSAKVAGTSFASLPATLVNNTTTKTINSSSLPTGAIPIYLDANGNAAIVIIPWQNGYVAIIGWDWHDAIPNGSQDGGWVAALKAVLDARDL